MVGWHNRCNEHELGQTLGDGERQGGLACCNPWSHKKSDMARQLNNNSNMVMVVVIAAINIHYAFGIVISPLHVLSHLNFTTIL